MEDRTTTVVAAVPTTGDWVVQLEGGGEYEVIAWAITADGDADGIVVTESGPMAGYLLASPFEYVRKP